MVPPIASGGHAVLTASAAGGVVGGVGAVVANALLMRHFGREVASYDDCECGSSDARACMIGASTGACSALLCPGCVHTSRLMPGDSITGDIYGGADHVQNILDHGFDKATDIGFDQAMTMGEFCAVAVPVSMAATLCTSRVIPSGSQDRTLDIGIKEPSPLKIPTDLPDCAIDEFMEKHARVCCVDELQVWDSGILLTAAQEGAAERMSNSPAVIEAGLTDVEAFCLYIYTWDYCLYFKMKEDHHMYHKRKYLLSPKERCPQQWSDKINPNQYFRRVNSVMHCVGCELGALGGDLPRDLSVIIGYQLRAMGKLPGIAEGEKLYRGMRASTTAEAIKRYTPGTRVYWYTFTSTTTDVRVASNFAKEDGVIFEITINDPDARDHCKLGGISAFGDKEREVLLRPNMMFVVTRNIESDSDHGDRTVVHIMQIHDDKLFERY